MKKQIPTFPKVMVPVIYGCDSEAAWMIARGISPAKSIRLVGLVNITQGESLSTAALPARQLRQDLKTLSSAQGFVSDEKVHVSHTPWEELVKAVRSECPDLLVMEWPCHFEALGISARQALAAPPCDIALVRGPLPKTPRSVLVSLRGGPYADLALKLSLALRRYAKVKVTALHMRPAAPEQDQAFRGLDLVLANLPNVRRVELQTSSPAEEINSLSKTMDIVILGATAQYQALDNWIGPVTRSVLEDSPAAVVIVKTKEPASPSFESQAAGQSAISVLVDQWFAENSYHADEFEDLETLVAQKERQGLTVSLALPALNEEKTVGQVIACVKTALMDQVPLLDEIVLIDSSSSDRTREIAADLGIPVYIHQQILPQYGARSGKGEALWKSLFVTRGDILLWIDTDIVNIHPSFVYGLLGPLILRPEILFIKGFYRRPINLDSKLHASGGGRVTELTARPLLNLFYPELSGIVQPLSGEYGGRRSALENLPFFSGYGVEIGLLIGAFEAYGLSAIGQADLQERIHHNQSLEALSKMSFAIIQAVIRKLERRYGNLFLEEVNKTMKLIRYETGRFYLDIEEIAEKERPPMASLPEYLERRRS